MKRVVAACLVCVLWSQPVLPQNARVLEEIVAKVNNEIILKSELDRAQKDLRAEFSERGLQGTSLEEAIAEQSKHVLRNLIDRSLLLQVAKEQGLTADLEVVRTMERLRQEHNFPTTEALESEIVKQGTTIEEFKDRIRTSHLTDEVVRHEVTSRIIITTEETRAFYDANQKDFDRPEGMRLQEITVFTDKRSPEEVAVQQKKIEEALAALKKGDNFEDVARKYSESEKAAEGGHFGFFQKGQLTKELEDVLSKIPKGQLTDIIKVSDGLMVFKVADRHSGGILSFELAQDEVRNFLLSQRATPRIREYLAKLRKDFFYVEVSPGYADTGTSSEPDKVSDAAPDKK